MTQRLAAGPLWLCVALCGGVAILASLLGCAATPQAAGPPRVLGAGGATLALGYFATPDVPFRHSPVELSVAGGDFPAPQRVRGVTDADGVLSLDLPPGTYRLTPKVADRELRFMGNAKTSPRDWPRSGSGWGPGAPPSRPTLELELGPGSDARYCYDADHGGPLTNALDVEVVDASGQPARAVLRVESLADPGAPGAPQRWPEAGPGPPKLEHPGLLAPHARLSMTDDAGLARLAVPPGRQRIWARTAYAIGHHDLSLTEVRAAPFRARVRLSEPLALGSVRVRVTRAGAPVAGPLRLVVREPQLSGSRRAEVQAGLALLHDLPPGVVRLDVFGTDWDTPLGQVTATVVAGEVVDAPLELP